jgi:hypothetical protein
MAKEPGVKLEKDDKPVEIEINDAPVSVEETKPTLEEAKESGLSAAELEAAKKHGLLAEGEKDADDKRKEGTDEEGDRADKPGVDDAGASGERKDAPRKYEVEDDPVKEQELLGKFNTNEKALYWTMKKDRLKRQEAEALRDHEAIKNKASEQRIADLQKQIDNLTKLAMGSKKSGDADEDPLGLGEGDEDKNGADKPLTRNDLEVIEKEKEEAAQKAEQERQEKAQQLKVRLDALEADAKARIPEFDAAINAAEDVLKNVDTLFKEPRVNAMVKRKIQVALAETVSGGDLAPDLMVEIGKLHPKYQEYADPGKKNGDKDGSLTPEQIRRMEENSRRRGSSASVAGGGGKRVVSLDDLTVEDAARMPSSQFRKLPREVRERLLRQ